MKRILLEVYVEIKEEHGALDNSYPSDQLVAAYVKDYTRDATRGDYDVNWMVYSVNVVDG